MEIKTRSLENYYGSEFSEEVGLTPLVIELIRLDKYPALRYIILLRKVLYRFILHAEKELKTFSPNRLTPHKLVCIINNIVMNNDGYREPELKKRKEDFEGLISVMSSTAFLYILDKLDLSPSQINEVQIELVKSFKIIGSVYDSSGGAKLNQYNNSILELFFLRFPENKKPMIIDEENIVQCEILSDQTDNENVEGINKLLLLSRQETADIFKISLPTLKDWEKKGAIPKAIHIGNRVYYRKHEIINFIGIS